MPSTITNTLVADLKSRDARGLESYGTTLDRDDLTIDEWLEHARNELLDGAAYLERLRRALRVGGCYAVRESTISDGFEVVDPTGAVVARGIDQGAMRAAAKRYQQAYELGKLAGHVPSPSSLNPGDQHA